MYSPDSFASDVKLDMHPPALKLMHILWIVLDVIISCVCATGTSIALPFVQKPPANASQILDPRLASFSIEFSYLTMFGGNRTHPNLLTKELMQRLVERTGVGPVSAALLIQR